MKRDCPQNENRGEPRVAKKKSCWNCGSDAHLSRECDQPENPDAKKPQRRGQKCYNCGEFGHISADCPEAFRGPKCYNCGEFGHISTACPEGKAETAE